MQPARSHFVPTSVTDRNGKLTTVYRRSAKVARTSGNFPAPDTVMAALERNASMGMGAVQRLMDCGVLRGGEPQDRAFKNLCALAKVSSPVLEELVAHIEHAAAEEQNLWYWVISSRDLDPDEFYVGRDVNLEGGEYYRRAMSVYGLAARVCKDIKDMPPSIAAETAIVDAECLLDGDWGESYTKLKAAVIVEGITMLRKMDQKSDPELTGDPLDDVQYIAGHLDAVERVLDELVFRRTTDRGAIAELTASHGALTGGNL